MKNKVEEITLKLIVSEFTIDPSNCLHPFTVGFTGANIFRPEKTRKTLATILQGAFISYRKPPQLRATILQSGALSLFAGPMTEIVL